MRRMVSSSECFRLKSAHNRNEPAIAHERIGHVQENTLGIALVVAAHVDVAALLGGDKVRDERLRDACLRALTKHDPGELADVSP
jgi:hypothetical protein